MSNCLVEVTAGHQRDMHAWLMHPDVLKAPYRARTASAGASHGTRSIGADWVRPPSAGVATSKDGVLERGPGTTRGSLGSEWRFVSQA